MRFKKLDSFLDGIETEENPKVVQASIKRAEKYLHRQIVQYLENHDEKELASRGTKLISIMHNAADTINDSTDDEIEYMVGDIKSKVKWFDKRMHRIVRKPTIIEDKKVKSASNKDYHKFSKEYQQKLPLRKNIELVRCTVSFVPSKSIYSWNKNASKKYSKVKEMEAKGMKVVVWERYPLMLDQWVMFVKMDYRPVEGKSPQQAGKYMFNHIVHRIKNLPEMVTINEGREYLHKVEKYRGDTYEYWHKDDNLYVIEHKDTYFAMWLITKRQNTLMDKYFGKIKGWHIP